MCALARRRVETATASGDGRVPHSTTRSSTAPLRAASDYPGTPGCPRPRHNPSRWAAACSYRTPHVSAALTRDQGGSITTASCVSACRASRPIRRGNRSVIACRDGPHADARSRRCHNLHQLRPIASTPPSLGKSRGRQKAAKSCSPASVVAAAAMALSSRARGHVRVSCRRSGSGLMSATR